MAIKGKGRSKGRSVARAPKRAPVPVPVPFYQRRWVQVTVALVVGFLAFWLITWIADGLEQNRLDDQRGTQRSILETWHGHVESELGDVGQLRDPATPLIAAQVRAAAKDVAKGKEPSIDTAAFETYADDLVAAADALESYDLAGAIRDHGFGKGASEILSSRAEMVQALRVYRTAAGLMALALDADDPADAVALAKRAIELLDTADALMTNAYNSFIIALSDAGIQLTPDLADLGGFGS
jgi:hypothetical protein